MYQLEIQRHTDVDLFGSLQLPEHCRAADRRGYPTSTTSTAASTAREREEEHEIQRHSDVDLFRSRHPWRRDDCPNTAGRLTQGSTQRRPLARQLALTQDQATRTSVQARLAADWSRGITYPRGASPAGYACHKIRQHFRCCRPGSDSLGIANGQSTATADVLSTRSKQ